MAYPTISLRDALSDVDRSAKRVKAFCQARRAEMAAGNVVSTTIFEVFIQLRQERAIMAAAAATPGIGPYAQAEKNNPTLDVVAEFTAMTGAIDGCIAWINTNFPKQGGSGYLLAQTLGPEGPVDRQFTPAETAGLRTQLDAVIAAIA